MERNGTIGRPCPACGSREADRGVRETRVFGAPLPVDRCRRCGTHSLGASADLEGYYGGEYWDAFRRARRPSRLFEFYDALCHILIARSHVRFIRARGASDPRRVRLLDIGSGRGENVGFFERKGFRCDAIEPDPGFAAQTARRLRAGRCLAGTLAAIPPGERYDIVCAFHVLEHAEEPIAFVRDAAARLAEGGRLYIEVPNGANPAVLRDSIERHPHVVHFTPEGLHALLRRAGSTVENLGVYRQIIDPRETRRLRKWSRLPRLIARGEACEPSPAPERGEHIRAWAGRPGSGSTAVT
ncbi:MAG: class I SAM-dependent methyltransferase [Planctomycetota bacterium]